MKRTLYQLLLSLLLLASWSARAQTTLQQESFEVTPGTGTSQVNTALTTTYTTATTGATNQYFLRTSNATVYTDVPGFYPASGGVSGGTLNGSYYYAGNAVQGPLGVRSRAPGAITLNSISVSGKASLKVLVGLASQRPNTGCAPQPCGRMEADDALQVQVRFNDNGSNTGTWNTIAQFFGDNAGGTGNGSWRQDVDLDGSSADDIAKGSPYMTYPMTDFTFDVTGGGNTMEVRLLVSEDGTGEEFLIDNIRVTGVTSSNVAPTLANIETANLAYEEGDGNKQITNTLTITDDGTTLSGATVRFSSGFNSSEDQLVFSTQNGITGNFSSTTGILTLTGTSSLTNYQNALRSVQYIDTDVIDAQAGTRVVAFQVTDTGSPAATSSSVSRSIVVTNHLDAAGGMPYAEDLESNGQGARYTGNFGTTGGNGRFFGRTNVASEPGGQWHVSGYSATTISGINNSFYVWGSGTSLFSGGLGSFITKQTNTAGYVNLNFSVKLAASNNVWESQAYLKVYYRLNGGSWVPLLSFRSSDQTASSGGVPSSTTGSLRQDANPATTTGVPTGALLTPTLITYSASLPASANSQLVDFKIDQLSYLADGVGEVIGFDNLQLTGTQLPTVTTATPTTIGGTSAVLGGNVTADGGATVTARGVVYSVNTTNNNPTIGGTGVTATTNGTGLGAFSATTSGLTANTTYAVAAYATNSGGTSYGPVLTFTTAAALSTTGSQTNVACNGGNNGTATVSVSGGLPPYTYSWTGNGSTTATATGLAAGSYTVTVTDATGATTQRTFIITQPTAISLATGSSTNVSCNGGANGTATVAPTGGTGGYSYAYSPSGGTGATATGLSAGTYTVTVTDANGCTAQRTFTITQPPVLATTGSQTNVACNGGTTGVAAVNVSGGTSGYTFAWQRTTAPTGAVTPSSSTASTSTISSQIAGTYVVTVTDANGCTTQRTFTITQPTAISLATGSSTNVSCNGGANGTATVAPTGGAGGYTYAYSPSGGTGATATGLSAGTYTVTVTDANGCTAQRTFTITQPPLLTTTGSQTNVACNGGNNGTATVVASGGTPSYSYSWSPSVSTTATATGLAAGTYTVTVTDANGCTAQRSFTITAPPTLTATTSQTNVTTFGGSNGSATITVGGGTPGYTYSWSPNVSTTATASNLSAGTYFVTATDANGCTIQRSFTITQPAAPTIVLAPASLPGATVGQSYSQALTASGGTSPYTYAVTGGALPAGLTLSNGTIAGTPTAGGSFSFTVTATDAGGFTGSRTYSAFSVSAATITLAPTTLPGGTVATPYSQTITASGGTPSYTFTYTGTLPTGLTLSSAGVLSGTPLAAGTFNFTVTATDASTGTGAPYSGSQAYTVAIASPLNTLWTGTISSDWYTAANWTTGVPTPTTSATILATALFMPLISAGTASTNNLTLNSGATLNQSGGTLDVRGDLTNNGTATLTGGTVNLGSGPSASVLGSSSTRFWNLTVASPGLQVGTSAGASVRRLLSLIGNLTTNANPLTLESDVTGTAMVVNNGAAVVNGNVSVQRYIDPAQNPNLGYRHISTAVSGQQVSNLTTGSFSPVVNPAYNGSATPLATTPFPTVYGYDQSRLATTSNNLPDFDKGWFSPSATTDPLNVGQGYTALIGGGQTWSFTGPLNNGNVSLTLARNSGATAANAGLALIGNPYPSPLDWSTVTAADRPNVNATMYVWRSNNPTNPYLGVYDFYNNGIGTISPVLSQGQGFFVAVASGQTLGTVNLQNKHRPSVYTATTYRRNTPLTETRPLVRLTLQGGGSASTDNAFVYFEAGASNGYEPQYDSEKLPNPSGLNLSSSLSATQRLAINGYAPLGSAQLVVPVAVGVPAVGSYTLEATELLNLGTVPVYLRDQQTGALIDLALQPSYPFTVSNASALITGRFELVFSPQQVLATAPAALAQQVGVYPSPAKNSAFLTLPASLGRQPVTATLVDGLGRAVRTFTLPTQGTAPHPLDLTELATGVYALRLTTNAGVVVKKLVIE